MTDNVLPISEVRKNLPKLVEDASVLAKTTYITVKGKVKAALVDPKELEANAATMEILFDTKTMKRIQESLEAIARGDVISWEDLKTELKWD